jgi:hypothetical protein
MNTNTHLMETQPTPNHINQIVQTITKHADEILLTLVPSERTKFVNRFGLLVEQTQHNEINWLVVVTHLRQIIAAIPKTAITEEEYHLSQLEVLENRLAHHNQADSDREQQLQLQSTLKQGYEKLTLALKKWRWFGAFKNDPTLDFIYDDIEQQRNLHWIGG